MADPLVGWLSLIANGILALSAAGAMCVGYKGLQTWQNELRVALTSTPREQFCEPSTESAMRSITFEDMLSSAMNIWIVLDAMPMRIRTLLLFWDGAWFTVTGRLIPALAAVEL